MMERLEIGGWVLDFDAESTRRVHATTEKGFPDRCRCKHCRNFTAGNVRPYPSEAIALLDRLGIEPASEVDVSYFGRVDSGLHNYQGWFRFVGVLRSHGEGGKISDPGTMTALGSNFEFFFAPETSYSETPVIRLEFSMLVPWVLEEPPSDGKPA